MNERTTGTWAIEEFGRTILGDVRRTRRLVEIAAGAARRPSGTVSAVFEERKAREGTYDLLESEHVPAYAIAEQVFRSTVFRALGEAFVYVMIDGSSLTLSDATGAKGFGPVATRRIPANGLMVTNALAVRSDGTPLGLIDQAFWSRDATLPLTKTEAIQRNAERSFEDKEPANFVRSAQRTIERLRGTGVRAWIIIDREGDNRGILTALAREDCIFTIRANYNRHLAPSGRGRLRDELAATTPLGTYVLHVGRTGRRPARSATLVLRAKQVELHFRARPNSTSEHLRVTAVSVIEETNEKDALSWTLYTNAPVQSEQDGLWIVEAYRARWRIEEFHRTWKRGECNIEDSQLRSVDAVVKWATIMAAVATRIERLKYSSRTKPDEAASTVLTEVEIEVLLHDQRKRVTKNGPRFRRKPVAAVTIGEATRWIGLLGGWIGEANGPPGSITLARGLERLGYLAQGVALAREMYPRK
jgi:hypothetical protein